MISDMTIWAYADDSSVTYGFDEEGNTSYYLHKDKDGNKLDDSYGDIPSDS